MNDQVVSRPAQGRASHGGPQDAEIARRIAEGLRSNPDGFRTHLATGRLDEAMVALGLELPAEGGGPFWRAVGFALTAHGCDTQAASVFERALTDPSMRGPGPADPYGIAWAETLNALGLCLAASGNLPQAELVCGQARGLAPHLPEMHVGLGRARLMSGKLDGAERVIGHALKLDPRLPAGLSALAAVQAARGDVAAALGTLDQALAGRPDSPRLRLQRARLLAAAGDWPGAGREARLVLAAWPWSAAAQRILAQAGLVAGDAAMAIPAAAQAATLAPEEPEAFALWSEALRLGGQPGQAAQAARRGLERHPEVARLHAALGLALMAAGQPAEAASALREGARLSPRDAVLAGNLVAVLAAAGEFEEALSRASELLAMDGLAPSVQRETRLLAGRILLQQGRATDGVAILEPLLPVPGQAGGTAPDLEVMLLHARALRHGGQPARALSALRQILSLRPGHRGAATEMAGLAASLRDWPAAEAALQPALQAAPEEPELAALMGQVVRQAGRPADALAWFLRAHSHSPQDWRHRRACGECLTALQANTARPDLEGLASRALAEAWARPKDLAPMAVSLLRQAPASAWIFDPAHRPTAADLDRISGMTLLQRLLRATPVPDWPFEEAMLRLRRTLLDSAVGRGLPFAEGWLPLAACLADYCWLTDYALAESAEEQALLEGLGRHLAASLQGGAQPAAPLVAMAAAYRHLSRLPGASRLTAGSWPDAMLPLLRRHLEDPGEERRIAAALETMGTIADPVSRKVMAHYDRAPYPRWSAVPLPPPGAGRAGALLSVQQALRARFPLLPPEDWPPPGPLEMLDAGCGTGQFTLELAGAHLCGSLTAMDLSRHALAYAARKFSEAGIRPVRFVQGDVLDLPATGWQFDMVNAVGLLHHLADPLAGWRALASVTRPGGVQRIGLYSRLGRQSVIAARQALSQLVQGDPDNAALRALRPRLLQGLDADTRAALARAPDFYALGSLRDMLFHVQERHFDLPAIAGHLAELGLEFLGFDLPDPALYGAYAAFAPEDAQMRDLARWAAFEAANPATFRGMYLFWVRKAG